MAENEARILQAGKNCWRVENADRVAFLIDSKRYFAVLDRVLPQAHRRIVIVGWDFDSNARLTPGGPVLSERLVKLVDANPLLEIHVLIWRSSLVYANNHDLPLSLGSNWYDHPRIHYRLDSEHPIGASHHQKIVALDDCLAFVGGIDLTEGRLDDCGHAFDCSDRTTFKGEAYDPVHDVQMLVDGDAAAAVAELAYERWRDGTAEDLQPLPMALPRLWPMGVTPDLRNHDVAIARTRAEYNSREAYREIERLNIDALRRAEKQIYIEAQYFAESTVAEILCEHLKNPDGPEVMAVVNYNSHGKLEQYVMGQNRDRLFGHLRQADRHGRLGLLFSRAHCDPHCDVKIHSKVMIVDDRFLRIGSSNLNQRSLGLDSECDLAIEATTLQARHSIRRFLRDLLADHLRAAPARVVQAYRANDRSLLRTVTRLGEGSCLLPYTVDESQAAPPVAFTAVLDPAEPFTLDRVISGLKR
ncbi:MAG: phospholipase [Alphaproteobacteria bacterium]|nr:phospholipase [Alphaproteobacteria bacterium]